MCSITSAACWSSPAFFESSAAHPIVPRHSTTIPMDCHFISLLLLFLIESKSFFRFLPHGCGFPTKHALSSAGQSRREHNHDKSCENADFRGLRSRTWSWRREARFQQKLKKG